jgi:hypothetical protein
MNLNEDPTNVILSDSSSDEEELAEAGMSRSGSPLRKLFVIFFKGTAQFLKNSFKGEEEEESGEEAVEEVGVEAEAEAEAVNSGSFILRRAGQFARFLWNTDLDPFSNLFKAIGLAVIPLV